MHTKRGMRSRVLLASSALLVLGACSGTTAPSESSPEDAQAGDAGARATGEDGATGADATPPSTCVSDPTPPFIDSGRTVHFVLTNTSASPRYVLSSATVCEPFSIDGVRLSVPRSCGCECPPPADSMRFEPLAPGASVTLDWNVARTVLYESRDSCAVWGHPETCASYTFGVAQAVSPGDYVAHFLVAASIAVDDSDAGYQLGPCHGSPDRGYECRVTSSVHDGACDASVVGVTTPPTRVDFTVPPSGDVTVPIAIP